MEPLNLELWDKINVLDLEPIKFKLVAEENWSLEKADAVESKYKQFLYLALTYSEKSIVPTKSIDSFWHYHILDTRKYSLDCESTFGCFLHHYPYLGMLGQQDYEKFQCAFEETKQLFLNVFNNSIGLGDELVFYGNDGGNCDSGSCDGEDCVTEADCGSEPMAISRIRPSRADTLRIVERH